MCGIAGIASPGSSEGYDIALLRRMSDVIRHRGPDDEGFLVRPGVGLAMRRLGIIDLAGGQQPILNEDGTVAVVCNGEIYNFKQLRSRLLGRGHRFKTRSDTEVIVHLYEEHGRDLIQYLSGMFAFALWDARHSSLLLARDRLGKKPLFYTQVGGDLVFGSEMKSILQVPGVSRQVDFAAIDAFLTFGYIPAPATIFEGIHKLPPGHWLELTVSGHRLEPYWELRFPAGSERCDAAEVQAELLEQLRIAVRMRLVSDVPLGAFLSGGIDSSAVVAMMAEALPGPVKTYSIGFAEQSFDETPYARLIAQRFGTDHREQIVEPEGIEDLLPQLVWHFDEPFGDSSALPTYYVSKLARSEVTVVLTGDGGDEGFAGYSAWQGERLSELYRSLPHAISSLLSVQNVGRVRRIAPRAARRLLTRAERVIDAATATPIERFGQKMTKVPADVRARLYSSSMIEKGLSRATEWLGLPLEPVDANVDPVNRLGYWMTRFYLPNDMLVKVDRMTMAHSLEARCPLLDHAVLELAARIPPELKLHGWTTKYILRRALRPLLPREVLWRPKHGFEVPLQAWFTGNLTNWAQEVLLSSRSVHRGYFAPEAVRRVITEHGGGVADHGALLWMMLNLEIWHRIFIDEQSARCEEPARPAIASAAE